MPNRGFSPYFPAGSRDRNGHSSRVMQRRSEESDTRVLVFPLCQISSWNTDNCLRLRLCPGWMLESKSPSSLSVYLYLSQLLPLSLSLKSSCHKFTCGDPGWHISARIVIQVFTQIFPSIFQSPIKYTSGGAKRNHLLVYRHYISAILPPIFPLSALSADPRTNSYVWGLRGPIYDSEINIYSTTLTWGL